MDEKAWQLGEVETQLRLVSEQISEVGKSEEAEGRRLELDTGALDLLLTQSRTLIKKQAAGEGDAGAELRDAWEAIDYLLGQISGLSSKEAEQLHQALQELGRRLESLAEAQTPAPAEEAVEIENAAASAAPEPDQALEAIFTRLRAAAARPLGPKKGRSKGRSERDRWLWLQDRGRRVFQHGADNTISGLSMLDSLIFRGAREEMITTGAALLAAYEVFIDEALAESPGSMIRASVSAAIRSAESAADALASAPGIDTPLPFAGFRRLVKRLVFDLGAVEQDFPLGGDPLVAAFREAELTGRGVSLISAARALADRSDHWPPRLQAISALAAAAERPTTDLAMVAVDILFGALLYKTEWGLPHVLEPFLDLGHPEMAALNEARDGEDRGGETRPPLSAGLCGRIADDLERELDPDGLFLAAMASSETSRFLSPILGERAEPAYAALREAAEAWLAAQEAPKLAVEDLQLLEPWRPALTPSPPYPEYHRDKPWIGPDGKLVSDPLGVVDDARAMADLISLEKPGPPLAIGLFGDWGSGKSSFMEILEKAIRENGERVAEARRAGGESLPFVEHVAHIRFNAWHYAEANLWASLAAHIFRELLSQAGKPDSARRRQVEALIGELGVAEEAAAQARAALVEAEQEARAAREALAQEEQAIVQAEKALSEAEQAGGWGAVNIPETVGETLSELGLGDAAPDAERLIELADEARGLGGHLRYFLSAALGGKGPGWGRILASGGIFLAVALGALALPLFAGVEAALAEVFAGLGALSGAVLAAANWALPHIQRVNTSLGELRQARDDAVTARRAAEEQARKGVREAASRLAETNAAARAAAVRHEAAQAALRRVEAVHAGDRPGELFMRLIETRAGEEGYAKHLGLVSQLHDDFQLMSDLLLEGEASGGKTLPRSKRPPIDRIVLYIDDLDRCPDETVIKVLEAVHLLLGLPLFVAVVGVDARWLEGALARSYSAQLQAGEVRPEEYLEKIFQLPYQLRPMSLEEGGGFEKLIASVMTDAERAARETPPTSNASGTRDDAAEDALKITEDDDEKRADEGGETGDKPRLEYVDIPPTPEEAIAAQRQIVTLTEQEYADIHALRPLIAKSPRATKRFMNLYRFEKARRMRIDAEAFLGGDGKQGESLAVMIRLALETGLPRLSNEIINMAGRSSHLQNFGAQAKEWRRLLHEDGWTPLTLANEIYAGSPPEALSGLAEAALRSTLKAALDDAVWAGQILEDMGDSAGLALLWLHHMQGLDGREAPPVQVMDEAEGP